MLSRSRFLTVTLVIATFLIAAANASAIQQLTIRIDETGATVAPGGSGYFDVYADFTPDSATDDLFGYSVRLETTAPLTAASAADVASSPVPVIADAFVPGSPSTLDVTGQNDSPANVTLEEGDVLFRVSFDVDAGATPGDYDVNFITGVSTLFDVSGNPLALTFVDGQIHVIPEPVSAVLLVGGLAAAFRRRRA